MQFSQLTLLAMSVFALNAAAAPRAAAKAQFLDLTSIFGTANEGEPCVSSPDCIGIGSSCCIKNDGTGRVCNAGNIPDVDCPLFLPPL